MQVAAPKILFFLPAFVTRLLTPRSRKSGYGLLLGCRSEVQARLAKNSIFFASICHAITEPPGHETPAMGFFWGVDQEYVDGGPFEKTFFDDVRKKKWPKPGEFFIVCFGPPSQSIGRVRISREGALDVRESRERRDKIVPKFSPEKQEKRNLNLASFFPRF